MLVSIKSKDEMRGRVRSRTKQSRHRVLPTPYAIELWGQGVKGAEGAPPQQHMAA